MSESELTWLNYVYISERTQKEKQGWSHLARNAGAEKPPGTAWANSPIFDVIRVRPHEIYDSTKAQVRYTSPDACVRDMTHRKMHPHAGFPEPATEREFGQGCECLAKALREHKVPRRQLSVQTMNVNNWGM